MPPLSVMIKPVSSSCNMRCSYCFYADVSAHREIANYGVMSRETMRQLVRRAFTYADGSVSFAFQGGEPTLAGVDFYREFLEEVRRHNTRGLQVSYALQTNGYTIDDELLELFAKNHFLLGISLDGLPEIHDALRKDSSGHGTWKQINQNIARIRNIGLEYNILCVVTAPVARSAKACWDALKGHQYLQFIPCIDEFDGKFSEFSLTPELYGQLLIDIFDCYERAFDAGRPVSERRFDNYMSMLAGMQPEACGMSGRCGLYFLSEADGSIYPCDFYVLDEWRMGNVHEMSFFRMEKTEASQRFRDVSLKLPEACFSCPWRGICRGGCRRDREPFMNGVSCVNRFCKSYQMFFEARMPRMKAMTQRLLIKQRGVQ